MLAKTVSVTFFRTLEINQRVATIQGEGSLIYSRKVIDSSEEQRALWHLFNLL